MQVLRLQMFHRQLISHTVLHSPGSFQLRNSTDIQQRNIKKCVNDIDTFVYKQSSSLLQRGHMPLCQRMSSEIHCKSSQNKSLLKTGLILQKPSASLLPAAPFASRKDLTSAIWKHPFTQSASLPPRLH